MPGEVSATTTVAFVRPPRASQSACCETTTVAVAAPPALPDERRGGLRWMRWTGVLVGVGLIVALLVSRSAGAQGPASLMFPVMIVGSALATFAYGTGSRSADLDRDRDRYLAYLDGLADELTAAAAGQRDRALRCHPAASSLWALIGTDRMWERRRGDTDFALVRIGTGTVDAAVRPAAPAPAAPGVPEDPVTAAAIRSFIDTYSTLPDMPVALSLHRPGTTVLGGADARGVVRSIICQLAVWHSPRDIAVVLVASEPLLPHWDWLKWLPHNHHPAAADDAGPLPMVYRELCGVADLDPSGPHVVVVVDGVAVDGVSDQGGAAVLVVGGTDVTATVANPDRLSVSQALACARRLAAYRPHDGGARAGWPAYMGIADLHAIEPNTLWHNRSGHRLRIPIGVTDTGDVLELDAKEAAEHGMGPHGLCIGATGSGKSELLRTVALGMIAGHPPEALNLILVDFKGGATFLDLARARHVAAVITNLGDEAHLVERMRDALLGEITRRQRILRDAGNLPGIAEYRRAREAGRTLPALPVLLVIVDEFSELLSHHPDFLDVFVAIGRLGRSLGIHLLLASQRLDEGRMRGLESHLSYRICLKTLSAAESRAMLGIPGAYELPSMPGAAYLKVGAGDPVRFHSSFVSGRTAVHANHTPITRPVVFRAAPARPDAAPAQVEGPALLDAVLDAVAGHGTPAHPVWLDPLPESPTLAEVIAQAPSGDLRVPIGWADRVFEQRRVPMMVDLTGAAGNVAVVGAPQSGKTTTLRTLITALAAAHDARRVQAYCLDFGGGLASVAHLPHVGAVAGRRDAELAARTVAQVVALVRRREAVFAAQHVDSIGDYRRRRALGDPVASQDPFGDVFLVVDGWATVRQEFDGLESAITSLAAEGLSVGVHVVLSASRWGDIRPALKDQIGTRIELRLGDPLDSEIDRTRARNVPVNRPGRGLTEDGMPLTVALPLLDEAGACAGPDGHRAPAIAMLPTQVGYETLAPPDRGVLLGLDDELAPVAVDFARQPHFVILGDSGCGKTAALRTLCHEIVRTGSGPQLVVIDPRRTLPHFPGATHASAAAQLTPVITALTAALERRIQERAPGPGIYLVVDDYDLLAGAPANPLAPLLPVLPHSRDIGLHLLIARRSAGAARAVYEPVLAAVRELDAMGLQMSAGADEGPLLGAARPRPLPPGRATLVRRDFGEQRIQVAWTAPA